jgi:hypothetical protein
VTQAATEPGEARGVIAETFADPAWKTFAAVRQRRWKQSDRFKAKKKVYDAGRYNEKLRPRRSTPEHKAEAASRRRAQRAAQRGAAT